MELIIGTLAAWGLLMLLWTLAGVLVLPLRRKDGISLAVLVRGADSAPALERHVKALLWLRNSGLLWWHIAVLTDNLDEDARNRAEHTVAEEDMSLVSTESLKDWMEESWM